MDVEDHIINEHATHFMAMLVAVYRKASKIAAQMTAEGILPEPEVGVGTIEFLHRNIDTFEEQLLPWNSFKILQRSPLEVCMLVRISITISNSHCVGLIGVWLMVL